MLSGRRLGPVISSSCSGLPPPPRCPPAASGRRRRPSRQPQRLPPPRRPTFRTARRRSARARNRLRLTRRRHRGPWAGSTPCVSRSEEHTSELQSRLHLVCRLLLEKKKKDKTTDEILNK